MITRNLLLTMVLVFAGFLFAAKVNAQGVPVELHYNPGNWNDFNSTRFLVSLYNNDTYETYDLETKSDRMIDGGTYNLGEVPAGNYTVSISQIYSYSQPSYFTWSAISKNYSNNGYFYSQPNNEIISSIDLVDYLDSLRLFVGR